MEDAVNRGDNAESMKKLTMMVYILQAVGVFAGITFIAGLVINHQKKDEVNGTWLESHFRWQTRTAWFGLLWMIIGLVTSLMFIGVFILLGNTCWLIYRIVKGYLAFNSEEKMYA